VKIQRRSRKSVMGSVKETAPIRSPSHLKYIRGFLCLCDEHGGCDGKIEAHHVRENNAGTGIKPPDSAAIPLCARHHKLLHDRGAKTFEKTFGLDLDRAAEILAQRSPHLRKIRSAA
jgi:hypothetical protein